MEYGYVNAAAAAVRRKPGHRREMVNQLLFGEAVKVIKTKHKGKWLKVESLYDGYAGWVTHHLVTLTAAAAMGNGDTYCSALINTITIKNECYQVPMGAFLPQYASGAGYLGADNYILETEAIHQPEPTADAIKDVACRYLNAPYLWGGKTVFGIDCSGFAQMVFKLCGIKIKRDASQQALQGKTVKRLQDARCGDLAFFKHKGKIIHVGIVLDANTIIHAAGKVRVDALTEAGIIHSGTHTQTHKLHSIKRFY